MSMRCYREPTFCASQHLPSKAPEGPFKLKQKLSKCLHDSSRIHCHEFSYS
jgi:hypothetical protein